MPWATRWIISIFAEATLFGKHEQQPDEQLITFCSPAFLAQIANDDDSSQSGLDLSLLEWLIPPDEEHFLVVTGYGSTCGKSDLNITASTPSPPPVPPPPAPPPSPPAPAVCNIDRRTAPNQGRRSVCNVWNDPQVITFDNPGMDPPRRRTFMTCNMKGMMPVLSNQHLEIIAGTTELQSASSQRRGVSLITAAPIWTAQCRTELVWHRVCVRIRLRLSLHRLQCRGLRL